MPSSNISRRRVDHEHWELVRARYEARGYDKEAYEYELDIGGIKKSQPLNTDIVVDADAG